LFKLLNIYLLLTSKDFISQLILQPDKDDMIARMKMMIAIKMQPKDELVHNTLLPIYSRMVEANILYHLQDTDFWRDLIRSD